MEDIEPKYFKRLLHSLKVRFIRIICPHEYECYKSRCIGTMDIEFYRCKLCGKEKCR